MFKEIFDTFCNLSFNSKDMKSYLSDGGINSYVRGAAMLVRKFELSPSNFLGPMRDTILAQTEK